MSLIGILLLGMMIFEAAWPTSQKTIQTDAVPQDVPAIQVEVPLEDRGVCFDGGQGCTVTNSAGKRVDASEWFHAENQRSYHLHRYSCADKSRIMLTAENGERHCIKF